MFRQRVRRKTYLLDNISKVILLGRTLAGALPGLGIGLDVAVRVEAADDAVGLAQDVATLLDEGLHLLDELLLVALVLGLGLGRLDLGGDHFQDGLDLVEALLEGYGHALGELLVVLPVLALLFLLGGLAHFLLGLLLLDLGEEGDVADGVALTIHDITIVVNFLAAADVRITAGQLGDGVTVLVDDISLVVDVKTRQRALFFLGLGLGLPALGVAQHVSIAVDHITVGVDAAAGQDLGVARDEAADNITAGRHNGTVLGDAEALKLREGALLRTLALALGDELDVPNDIAGLAENLAVLVAHAADAVLQVTLDETPIDDTTAVDGVASLVDSLPGERRHVNRLLGSLFFLFVTLSLTDDVSVGVEDVTVSVNSLALQGLEVAIDDLTDGLILPLYPSLGVDDITFERLEGLALHQVLQFIVRNRLRAPDLLATVVPDDAVLINLTADQILHSALCDATNGLALVVYDVAGFVDLTTLEDGVVNVRRLGGAGLVGCRFRASICLCTDVGLTVLDILRKLLAFSLAGFGLTLGVLSLLLSRLALGELSLTVSSLTLSFLGLTLGELSWGAHGCLSRTWSGLTRAWSSLAFGVSLGVRLSGLGSSAILVFCRRLVSGVGDGVIGTKLLTRDVRKALFGVLGLAGRVLLRVLLGAGLALAGGGEGLAAALAQLFLELLDGVFRGRVGTALLAAAAEETLDARSEAGEASAALGGGLLALLLTFLGGLGQVLAFVVRHATGLGLGLRLSLLGGVVDFLAHVLLRVRVLAGSTEALVALGTLVAAGGLDTDGLLVLVLDRLVGNGFRAAECGGGFGGFVHLGLGLASRLGLLQFGLLNALVLLQLSLAALSNLGARILRSRLALAPWPTSGGMRVRHNVLCFGDVVDW